MSIDEAPIDEKTLRKVARLARLKVADADVPQLTGELGKIISWIERLQEVDVDGVQPMASVLGSHLRPRADLVKDGNQPDKILANAPDSAAGFFAVPKVVE